MPGEGGPGEGSALAFAFTFVVSALKLGGVLAILLAVRVPSLCQKSPFA